MEPGNGVRTSRRIALTLQYDGTRFNGWQIQSGGVTVQGELEKAIYILIKKETRVTASGRTDAGVHALAQVAHFDTTDGIALQRLCVALNGILPKDITVLNAYLVPHDFHARFDAVERAYRYVIYNHRFRSPFTAYRAMWLHDRLDPHYIRDASRHLVGEMDYSSFCKKSESDGISTVRRITAIDIREKGDWIYFDIRGTGFLHHMVRIIIGTLVEMSRKKEDPGVMAEIISRRDRIYSGFTAPACGLYLKDVIYEPSLDTMDAAF